MRIDWQRVRLFVGAHRRAVLCASAATLVVASALTVGAVYRSFSHKGADKMEVIQPLPTPDYRVLVEKAAHKLTLYEGNRVVKTWPVITGAGHGDKLKEGDRCTPLGDFFVCYKNPQSKYVLSLGLSYPNVKDAQRGLREAIITQEEHDAIVSAVRGRSFDANTWEALWQTALGGEIMIHGSKGDRATTAGCVAMDDEAIRELYKLLPYGTPVKIAP
jgi:murein L,D-transpeptidase YafK